MSNTQVEQENTGVAPIRIASLDSLRGLAILLVLLFHCTPNANPNLGLSSTVFKLATIGWAGVDLFFVLSGYLVCSILLDLKQRGRPLSVFFWNRFMRIMPIYYLSLIFVLLLFPMLTGEELPGFQSTFQYWFYLSNNTPELGSAFYSADIDLGHFWSLALEVQFYLIFPLLATALSQDRLAKVLIFVWLGVVVWRTCAIYTGTDASITVNHSQFRCDGLLLGALVAVYRQNLKSNRLFILLAALSACYLLWVIWFSQGSAIYKSHARFYHYRALLPIATNVLSAYALIFALDKREFKFGFKSSTGFEFSPLGFFAKYSYGMYVYHFLFNSYLERSLLPWLSGMLVGQNLISFGYFCIQLCISTALAYTSFHLVEKFFLRRKKH